MRRPDRKAGERIDRIYAEIPDSGCNGLCHESCGPIFMERVEWERIKDRLGMEPKATPEYVKALRCPMLSAENRCTVYDIRPTICRLFGSVENPKLKCPFGCVPEKPLSDSEAYDLLGRVRKAGS